MEHSDVLPTTQLDYRKGLGTCYTILGVSHTQESSLESGQETRIVQIDFRTNFDRVKHQRILYKLSFEDIRGSALFMLAQFQSNLS